MYRLPNRLAALSMVGLLALVGCQGVQPSQQVSVSVDQVKVALALDGYEAVRGDWAEQYANLSVEEMEVFIDLGYKRALQQFEVLKRNPFAEQSVMLDSAGRVTQKYDPAGRVETREVRLSAKELSQQLAQIEQEYRLRLAMHRLSVERHGVSFNAINGKQLDSLLEEAEAQTSDLSVQQSCTYNGNVYPRSGTVPYVGVSALPRSMTYIGTISDGGCDYFYVASGSGSISRLSQNPSASERCISRLAGLPMGQSVTSYARRRAAQESASRYILGPKTRTDAFCGAPRPQNWARSARAS